MSEVVDLRERRSALDCSPSEARRQSDFNRLAFSHETPALTIHYRDERGQLQRLSVSMTGAMPCERMSDILLSQVERTLCLLGGRLESVERVHSHAWEIMYG